MSGHSKWSTIKRKKAANDARRGNVFTRLAREISIAAREGGGDPDANFALRLAVDRARDNNMPKENIERSIRRGTGDDKEGGSLDHVMYEGYGPHGVALLVEVVTDNRKRSVADVRHALSHSGGSMAEAGSVAWNFHQAAYFAFPAEGLDSDRVFEVAVEAGADDVIIGGDDIEIIGPVATFKSVNDQIQALGIQPEEAGLRMLPNTTIELPGAQALQVMRLIENLEELDDVQEVYSNLEVTEEAVGMLETA